MPRMRTLPTYDDAVLLPGGSRLAVPADYGDLNGHLNVRNYVAIYDDAEWEIFGGMGIGAVEAAAGIGGVFALEQCLTYRREVLVGEEVSSHVRVITRRGALLHAVSYLLNHTRGEVAGSMEALEGWVSFESRRLTPFPDRAAEALDALAAEAAALPWQPQLSGSIRL